VAMGDELVAGGRVRAVDGDRVTLDLWVRVDGGVVRWPIKRGEAVVRLP